MTQLHLFLLEKILFPFSKKMKKKNISNKQKTVLQISQFRIVKFKTVQKHSFFVAKFLSQFSSVSHKAGFKLTTVPHRNVNKNCRTK